VANTLTQERRFRLIFSLAIVFAGVLIQALLRSDYFVGFYNDDAAYLQKAWSFAFAGRCPVCSMQLEPTTYAIGWPLFLTPFAWLAGGHLVVYRAVSVLLTIFTVILAADLCRKQFGRPQAILLALVLLLCQAALDYGSTLLSEPFYAAVIMTVVWLDDSRESRRFEIVKWLLAALCLCTRAEGILVPLALLASRGMKKSWRFGLLYPATFLFCWFALMRITQVPGAIHLGFSASFFEPGFPMFAYFTAWLKNQALLLGRAFFYGPAWLARAFAGALIVVTLYGAATSPRRREWLGFWLILGNSAALLFWPYLDSRYWFMTLPLWMLAALGALPRSGQLAALALTLVLQGGSLLTGGEHRGHLAPTFELYKNLDLVGQDEVVSSSLSLRVHQIAHRTGRSFQGAPSVGPIARNLSNADIEYLVWERKTSLIRNIQGTTQFEFPRSLDLWLERCPLFQVIYSNEAGVIVRLLAPREKLEEAFALWKQAFAAPDLESRKRSLKQALSVLPDLPELRILWIYAGLETQPFPAVETSKDAIDYFRQYPHDFENAQLVIKGLADRGAEPAAREIASFCYQEAQNNRDSRHQQLFAPGR
jgi:hypothetical protein